MTGEMSKDSVQQTLATLSMLLLKDAFKQYQLKKPPSICLITDDDPNEIIFAEKFQQKCGLDVNIVSRKTSSNVNSNNNQSDLKNIIVSKMNPMAFLYLNNFSFIGLTTKDSTAKYLEAIASSITHKGFMVITASDISTRTPERALRLYNGRIFKCEFTLELTLRLLLANIVRALAKYDKGMQPICSYGDNDGVTAIVQVFKGSENADKGLRMIKYLAYCRECLDRKFLPNDQYAAKETVGNKLNCCCQLTNDIHPPILLLGPIWSSKIIDTNYMFGMCKYIPELKLSASVIAVLEMIIEESVCHHTENDITEQLHKYFTASDIPCIEYHNKQLAFAEDELSCYYDTSKYGVSGKNLPKMKEVISELRKNFRASRTHFNRNGIRTSAKPSDIKDILTRIAVKTKT